MANNVETNETNEKTKIKIKHGDPEGLKNENC